MRVAQIKERPEGVSAVVDAAAIFTSGAGFVNAETGETKLGKDVYADHAMGSIGVLALFENGSPAAMIICLPKGEQVFVREEFRATLDKDACLSHISPDLRQVIRRKRRKCDPDHID